MRNKILRLSPIESAFTQNANRNNTTGRVLNLNELEIYQNQQDYFINSPLGKLKLKNGDELLIDHVAFKVSFFEDNNFEAALFKSESESYTFEHEKEFDSLSQAQKQSHPLAFLFNDGRSDD